MYCRNCGTQMGEKDKNCVQCDYLRGHGVDYCPDCGAPTKARDRKCPECGGTLFILRNLKPRRRFTTALLAFTVGMFGIHNFYLGYMRRALLQLTLSVISLAILLLLQFGLVAGVPIFTFVWACFEGVKVVIGNTRVDADGKFLI